MCPVRGVTGPQTRSPSGTSARSATLSATSSQWRNGPENPSAKSVGSRLRESVSKQWLSISPIRSAIAGALRAEAVPIARQIPRMTAFTIPALVGGLAMAGEFVRAADRDPYAPDAGPNHARHEALEAEYEALGAKVTKATPPITLKGTRPTSRPHAMVSVGVRFGALALRVHRDAVQPRRLHNY